MLWALVLSVIFHLAAYGGWRWGKTHAWWNRLTFPSWLQLVPHNPHSNPLRPIALLQKPQPPPPLLYVDVDPALAVEQAPANAKYYSTANTVAANPEVKKPSDQPNISGTQNKLMQTVPTGVRNFPLQPSPPPPQNTPPAEKEMTEAKAQPKPKQAPGELATAKPADKTDESKGAAETETGSAAKTEPKRDRPRTLAEARARTGAPNERTRQEGGVNHIAVDSSLDTKRTVTGDYDRELVDAVDQRWNALLANREWDSGEIRLSFNLHPDGRVTDMKIEYSTVNELLGIICEQAILDPSPFKKWPEKMREEVPDPRPVTFTFYYSN
jgi:outer membrane biosynthesis protein TonB